MAYFLLIADHPKWPLYLVASHLNQSSPYVSFDLRRVRRKKSGGGKRMFLLSWGISEGRLMGSSEWRDLQAYDQNLANWARENIERFMNEEKIDVEIENDLEAEFA